MKILETPPPNFAEIKQYFDVDKYKPVFCYGDTIFNPYKTQIPIDIQIHEEVHSKQQSEYSNPSFWWQCYLLDKDFRAKMETEAYAVQWQWVKDNLPAKASKEALNEFAENLSSPLYDLDITTSQAETLIRHYGK